MGDLALQRVVIFFVSYYSMFGRPHIIKIFHISQIIVCIYFHTYNRSCVGQICVGEGFSVIRIGVTYSSVAYKRNEKLYWTTFLNVKMTGFNNLTEYKRQISQTIKNYRSHGLKK
jgi:hypothetical protein